MFYALWKKAKPKYDDDIVQVLRFKSKELAISFIVKTLSQNVDEIVNWQLSDIQQDLVVTASYNEATGDTLVKNTDWTKPIPMHKVLVVLRKNFRVLSRSFVIVTAYPDSTMEDVDVIYDALDAYAAQKAQKNQ